MIKLFSTVHPDEVLTFLGGKKYKIGRKNGDITFPNDQSISRDHAEIEVDHPRANLDNPSLLPTLTVTDVGSKFKTYINSDIDSDYGVGISTREPVSLSSGDRVRFGKQSKIFRVVCTPLVVTGSTLKDAKELKDLICKLGGHFVADWCDKCDFVVMDSITLTIKAVCALLAGRYIVTPNYFRDLVESIQNGSNIPIDPSDYTPPLAESSIQSSAVDFKPNPERSRLFSGKTFVYYNNRQMKKFLAAVECGGGQNKLLNECSPAFLASPDTLLFHHPVFQDSKLDADTKKAIQNYKNSNKRYVQESEISLAAVYVNLDKHCNPFFNLAQKILHPVPSQTQSQMSASSAHVIIPETQAAETQSPVNPNSRVVVEESFNMTSGSDKSPPSSHSKTEVNSRKNHEQLGFDRNPKPSTFKSDEQMGPPSAKRRLERESETPASVALQVHNEPTAKRQKSSVEEKPAKTLTKSGSKTLSSIFLMSDSDPEDEDEDSFIPATYPANSSLPQPPPESTPTIQQPTASVSSSASTATAFVDFVPGTPEMSEEEDDFLAGLGIIVPESVDDVATSKTSRSTRTNTSRRQAVDVIDVDDEDNDVNISELPTVKIPTLSTAQLPTLVMNPYYSSPSKREKKAGKDSVVIKEETGVGSTSKTAKSSVGGKGTLSAWLTSNKRKTSKDEDEDEDNDIDLRKGKSKRAKTDEVSASDILGRTKQLKLEDSGPHPNNKDVSANRSKVAPAPVEVVSLIRSRRPDFPEDLKVNVTSVQNGSPRNFKRFQRVAPFSMYNSTLQNSIQSHSNGHQENQIEQKPLIAERVTRKFIAVDVNELPEHKFPVDDPYDQENFDFDEKPSTSRRAKAGAKADSEDMRKGGRGRKRQDTPVSVVCDVDVDMNAILTPSERYGVKEDVIDVDDVDPSDGMFDF